jgi:hypothetical protein
LLSSGKDIMRNTKKTAVVLLVMVLGVTLATVVASLRTQDSGAQGSASGDQVPIVDYDAPDPNDPDERAMRQTRSRRYDNSGLVIEPQKPGGQILLMDHTIGRLPSIPVNLSDAIVIGDITDAQAHLSADKTGVYTEFVLRVDEILKDGSGSLKIGGQLLAQRLGGRVRFPSGTVQRYGISKLGMPQSGRRYALFLKKNDTDDAFVIVTGYELRAGVVHPLDGVDIPGGASELPQFVPYKGMDLTQFLTRVRTAI